MLSELYEIMESAESGDEKAVRIRLNRNHPIYESHFQGRPITPGAIILQMCIEMLPEGVVIDEIKNVKFLKPHEPEMSQEIEIKCLRKDSCFDFLVSDPSNTYARLRLLTK